MTGRRQLLSADDGYELGPGAAATEIAATEAALEAVFPADLRQLYVCAAMNTVEGANLRRVNRFPGMRRPIRT